MMSHDDYVAAVVDDEIAFQELKSRLATTVPNKKTQHFGIFPYKTPIFKRVWQTLKVLPKP